MTTHVRLEDGWRLLTLEAAPLGRGGEASVYPIVGQPDLVAKIYHEPTAELADKLAAMLAAPPPTLGADGHVAIAWPLGRLLGPDGAVIGCLMPRVAEALSICEFYNPSARGRHCPLFHWGYLLRTARNLAAVVRTLHEAGHVIGDLNESNVLVSSQALVTLVDADSFQIRSPERLFRCRVGRGDLTPPELQGVSFSEHDRIPEQDTFALAVLIFQLLMQGIHPFAGLYPDNPEPVSIPERIVAGHWPYAWEPRSSCVPVPRAPPWSVLPIAIQDLLWRCFDEGHASPFARPTAREWQQTLEETEKQLNVCPINGQHLFAHGLDGCPWCMLEEEQERDPFPSPDEVRVRRARAEARHRARASQPVLVATAARGEGSIREDPDPVPLPTGGPATAAEPMPSSWADEFFVGVGAALERPWCRLLVRVVVVAALLGLGWALSPRL
jgi:DNA-binding helix-hairpin-helix protein with protein kinase domain